MTEVAQLPDRMVPDAEVAMLIVDNACTAHGTYHKLVSKHQDHLDGKPPYDPKKLKDHKQAWRHNRNHFKATSKIEKVTVEANASVYAAVSNSFPVFNSWDPETHKSDDKLFLRDKKLVDQYAMDISRAYGDIFDDDEDTSDYVSRINYNSKTWGVGFSLREPGTARHWLGEAYDIRDILLPKRTRKRDINKFVAIDEKDILFFYKTLINRDPQSSWNKEGLEELLLHFYNGTQDKTKEKAERWEKIAPSFAARCAHIVESSDAVRYSKIFNEEIDGSLTVSYFAYVGEAHAGGRRSSQNEFKPKHLLYQKNFPGTSVFDVLFLVRDSAITSTGCIQDMRGLSRHAVPDSHEFNKKKNTMNDKELIFGLPQFLQTSANQGEKFNIAITAAGVIFPERFELAPQQFNPNLAPLIQSLQAQEQAYIRETQHYDPSIQGKLGDRATTREVQAAHQEVQTAKQSKSRISLQDWSLIHQSNLKTLSQKGAFKKQDPGYKTWRAFIDSLKDLWQLDEGQVVSVLQEITAFKLEYSLDDIEAIERSLQLVKDPAAKTELERQYLYALGHPRSRIERMIPRSESGQVGSSSEEVHAELINDSFWIRSGQIIEYQPDFRIQLNTHFRLFQQAIDNVNQGVDPQKTYVYLQNGLLYTAKIVLLMERDPFYANDVQFYLAYQKEYEKLAKQIQSIAQEQAKQLAQEQEQQTIDPETQAKIETDRLTAIHKMQQAEKKQEFSQALRKENQEFSNQLKLRSQQFNHLQKAQDQQFNKSLKLADAI